MHHLRHTDAFKAVAYLKRATDDRSICLKNPHRIKTKKPVVIERLQYHLNIPSTVSVSYEVA